jgi:uncharacterized protein
MTSKPGYLLDVNALIALGDRDHVHHQLVLRWFQTPDLDWGVCAFTEAGFLRISTNPRLGSHTAKGAAAVLADLAARPGYRYWPTTTSWITLTTPFRDRIFGHQQINDALLLGLAVKENGVLVTMDKAVRSLAGARLAHHVLVLS